VSGQLEIALTNTAPSTGLPDYVLNNAIDQLPGTNRSLVSVYTGVPVTAVARDGNPVAADFGLEEGWRTTTLQVTLAPGASTVIRLDVAGEVDPAGYTLLRRTQPMVIPEVVDVAVIAPDRSPVLSFSG
jgi:hypothetical protein